MNYWIKNQSAAYSYFTISFLCISLFSCTDPINFDSSTDKDYIIVDGFVSSAPGPYEIRLFHSAAFDRVFEGGLEVPISTASVWIRDNFGLYINLINRGNGSYVTPDGFRGEVGRIYTLHFTTEDGNEYQSTREEILPPDEIANARFENGFQEILSSQDRVIQRPGILYYIDSEFLSDNRYYRWDWEGTYIKETTFFTDESSREFCYIDERASDHVVIFDATQAGTNGVTDKLIHFMEIDIRFNFGYNINLLQYSISEESYEYWRLIEQQRKKAGTVFDATPANIVGNIININDADDVVLGRFEAYGASNARMGITPFDLPFIPEFVDMSCFVPPFSEPPPYCFDCALFPGSRPDRPDFWID